MKDYNIDDILETYEEFKAVYNETIGPIIDAYNEAVEILGEFKANISNMEIVVLARTIVDLIENGETILDLSSIAIVSPFPCTVSRLVRFGC